MKIKTQYSNYDNVSISVGTYGNGRLAISLICDDGIPLMKATVNLPHNSCAIGHCFIKDYSENTGILRQLIDYGIISEPIGFVSGHNGLKIPYVKFLSSTPAIK